jgi:hypothetical protein
MARGCDKKTRFGPRLLKVCPRMIWIIRGFMLHSSPENLDRYVDPLQEDDSNRKICNFKNIGYLLCHVTAGFTKFYCE